MYNNSIRNFIFLAPLEIISKIITTNICIPQKPPGDVCAIGLERERESKSGLPPLFFSTLPRWFRPTVSSSKPIGGCRWLFVLVVVPLSFFLSVVCVIDDRVFLSRHYASQMIAQSGKTLMYGLVCVLVWVCPCRLLMDGGSARNTTQKETEMVFFFALTNGHIFFRWRGVIINW